MDKPMVVELPKTNAHEVAAGEISDQILRSVLAISNERALVQRPSPTLQVGSGSKEPDFSFGPRGLAAEAMARNATTVVEIGYKHGTLATLKAKLRDWVAPESPIVSAIGIKISGESNGTRKLLALLYKKGAGNPVQEIEFGTDIPDIQLEGLVLNVSLRDLLFGAHGIQGAELTAALHNDLQIGINLATLQKEILQVCC